MRRFTLALILVSAASLSGQTPSQTPEKKPDPTAAISGIVVNGSTNEPVENSAVTIQGAGTNRLFQTRQFTDAKGRFVFVNLPPGLDYTLSANTPGYFTGTVSRDTGPTTQSSAVALKEDEWVRDVRIAVWRPGSISGRVLDEAGDPAVGVYVRTLARVPIAGREQLISGPIAISDDRGVYRIAGLNAGQYLVQVPSVQATPSSSPGQTTAYYGISGRFPWAPAPGADGRPRAYPITFYPGTRSVSEAVPVEVKLTEERSGVDITLEPVPVFTVSGFIQGPADGLTLRLMSAGLETLGIGSEAAAAPIAADGAFAFSGVPAGAYFIDARRRVPEFSNNLSLSPGRLPNSAPVLSSSMFSNAVLAAPPGISLSETQYGNNQNASASHARQAITLGGSDLTGVIVVLKNSGVMDGTIDIDASPNKPDAKPAPFQLGLALDPASGDPDLGAPVTTQGGRGGAAGPADAQQNAFHFDGLRGGVYFLRSRGGKDWIVKSVTWNGEDYTHRPFDSSATAAFTGVKVTMTNRVASITGSVKELNAAVVMFPANQDQWSGFGFNPPLIKTVYTANNGSFRFEGLPAGDYLVVAVPTAERMAWLEPGFFNRIAPTATRVSLSWGESGSANLSVVAVRR